jgi:thymidine kinase
MFIEPGIKGEKRGWIEVICGSMFSGKTEELIRRLKRVKIANQTSIIFKPSIDNRYSKNEIISHDTNTMLSIPLNQASQILEMVKNEDVVGIDEAQFFDENIVAVCEKLANEGKRVIVAGLDMDFTGTPFGPMPNLLAISDYITKLHAICVKCGNIAHVSYRIVAQQEQVVIGERNVYEPRCRICASNV